VKISFLFFLSIALPAFLFGQSTAIVTGKIKDTEGYPVEYANVYVRDQGEGTFTDIDGDFSLELETGSEILIEVSHTAFKNKSIEIDLFAGEIKKVNVTLEFRELKGVEIKDKRTRQTTMSPVPLKDIKINPNVQQGVESVLTSQLGVSMNNELSSNYSVRGGSYAENLVYVNDIQVYRPFLARSGVQEGLSFPNPDLIGSINFSAGGFDARYGDKMSSVLDIKYKKPRSFGGSASLSLLGGSASLESASKDRRLTQVSGIRYKTNQYILGSLDTQGDYQPNFADFQTFWSYDFNEQWEVAFLGNYSSNNFKFVPGTRQTQFGSINEALRFTVFFEGQEVTSFETFFGAVSTDYKPNSDTRLKFTASAFRTFEHETFDILGQYFLDELERDLGDDEFGDVVRNRGVGTFLEHGRNRLDATVYSFQHRGFKTIDNKYLQWGLTWRTEEINDRLSEWNYIDSAGYSVPTSPGNQIRLQDVIKGRNQIKSNRIMGYVQNEWDWLLNNESQITATAGVRAQYWDYNDQTVVSPRGTIAWKPEWSQELNDSTTLTRDVVFRFSTGFYYQMPFYRALRDLDGTLNPDIRAQRAIHYVLGADINFRMWNRPFKFITEAYYKDLDNIIPYEIDNVRIRYYGNNDSKGYSTGLDLKIHGEFIPGIESWANLSFLKTEEDLQNDFYYETTLPNGEEVIPGFTDIPEGTELDSNLVEPGYIPRPTDQLIYFSMFFQDEMPNFESFKVHLSVIFGTGLPFGPPDFERYKDVNRFRAYRRVDIGFSKDLTPKEPGKKLFGTFDTAVLSLEVWNLLDINNTISYTFIKESSGRQYGVPNFLTSRRLNVKLAFSF
jgi:hypothetical protein